MIDFLWTDKSSSKWFVIYPQGHEGPYSLQYLESKVLAGTFSNQVKVWSEGLASEMTLEAVLTLASPVTNEVMADEPPELPALPEENPPAIKKDKSPKLPVQNHPTINNDSAVTKSHIPINGEEVEAESIEEDDLEEELAPVKKVVMTPRKKWGGKIVAISLMITSLAAGALYYLQKEKKQIAIQRPQGMSLKTADRINQYLEFKNWDEPLFLKEFIAEDYSSLWLVTSSFQQCLITANFKSQKDKLLSLSDGVVEFEGTSVLKNHLAEFQKINFISGKKIVPGMYDMTVEARECQWDGIVAKVMNQGRAPEPIYSAKMTVILYPNGAEEFKDLLDRVIRKKLDKAVEEQNQIELFWQGVQEKLQTLLAVSLQIEQLFIDFLNKDTRKYKENLPVMINDYTKKFGQFLTNFVVANAESFKENKLKDLRGISNLKNYENDISESAKELGFTSMKLIEDLQKKKNPRRGQLNELIERVKNEFSQLKKEINQKIIQVSEDRSLPLVEDPEEHSPSPE